MLMRLELRGRMMASLDRFKRDLHKCINSFKDQIGSQFCEDIIIDLLGLHKVLATLIFEVHSLV